MPAQHRRLPVALAVALLGAALLAPVAAAAHSPLDASYVRWVPRLMTQQKRLYAMTRTYLKQPDDAANAEAQAVRLFDTAKSADVALRRLRLTFGADKLARAELLRACDELRSGALNWSHFLAAHAAIAADPGPVSATALKRMRRYHDLAEASFTRAWKRIARVDYDLDRPLRTVPRSPSIPGAPAPPRDPIVGDWNAGGGVLRITATGATTFEGRLVKTYTFCRSGSVPLNQVEAVITRTSVNHYSLTLRFYRLSDCTWIGDATGATYLYRPADDTIYACSWSPNPSYPGGGCSVSTRAKT